MPENISETIIFKSFSAVLVLAGAVSAFIVFRHAVLGASLFYYSDGFYYAASANTSAIGLKGDKSKRAASVSRPANLPSGVYIKVPFTPQAPFLDWSGFYGEACEEASVIMAMAWAQGENLTPAMVNAKILGLVAYENFYFGYNNDTALRETAKIFTRYYGYQKVKEVYDINLNDIKFELASGNIVVVPASGVMLLNPYYVSPPPYHMLVITGYDDISEEFITNDPGTRHGESYRYSYDTLWSAIHDWTGDEATLLEGRKGMIVVEPQARRKNP